MSTQVGTAPAVRKGRPGVSLAVFALALVAGWWLVQRRRTTWRRGHLLATAATVPSRQQCNAPASPDAPSRPRWRRAASAVLMLLSLALLGFWVVALRPLSLGGPANYTVIHGNSMWPLYRDGDLIITTKQTAYFTGEVVAYRVPRGEIGQGHLVIHRIVGGSTSTGLRLKGDHNPDVDPWHPRLVDVAGSTWMQIPRAGRLLVLLHQPLALAVVTALITVAVALRRTPARPQAGSLARSRAPRR